MQTDAKSQFGLQKSHVNGKRICDKGTMVFQLQTYESSPQLADNLTALID